ncbi:MAG: sigma-54-dependent Fis family transcriptional regulator [Deltaproteobacteria bacterium]|nr:sigma-54-dependent Fis family transcriptional regulator [Deltaproteobacteria bacterium]
MRTRSILIVDDEPSMRMALSESLESCGFTVATAANGCEALEIFRADRFELVITDMKMPKMGGMELLRGIKERSPDTPVVVITAYGTVNTAVEAMREGAADFIMKPFSLDSLESVVKRVLSDAADGARMPREIHSTRASGSVERSIITSDASMKRLIEIIETVAASKSSVLIQGESGTGKELFARHLHVHSNRAAMPFVAINCAAIPQNLLESEMFGFEKGAFTGASFRKIGKFELAQGGTLLLDEISEMDVQLQAKLLRALQESEIDRLGGKEPVSVDVRIIATTNRDLKKRIAEERFREDLYYRLNVIPLRIPPLRERKGDMDVLIDHFLEKYCVINGRQKPFLSGEVRSLLQQYSWPGNVRELENVIERAILLCGNCAIGPEHLHLEGAAVNCGVSSAEEKYAEPVEPALAEQPTLRDHEKKIIFDTLASVGGNKTRASQLLGISVRTMRNKLNEYKKDASLS